MKTAGLGKCIAYSGSNINYLLLKLVALGYRKTMLHFTSKRYNIYLFNKGVKYLFVAPKDCIIPEAQLRQTKVLK